MGFSGNVNSGMTHAVMKHLWLLLVLLLLLEGQAVLIIARMFVQSPTAAGKNPYVGIIGNVIASQGLILPTLQIISRSIDQLGMMFTEYVW